jgi:hypothetical protein
MLSCRTGPLRVGRALRAVLPVVARGDSAVLPLVGARFIPTNGRGHAKPITRHEVTYFNVYDAAVTNW